MPEIRFEYLSYGKDPSSSPKKTSMNPIYFKSELKQLELLKSEREIEKETEIARAFEEGKKIQIEKTFLFKKDSHDDFYFCGIFTIIHSTPSVFSSLGITIPIPPGITL